MRFENGNEIKIKKRRINKIIRNISGKSWMF